MTDEIPDDHPRAESLRIRHRIIEGLHKNVVAEAGLFAHGRGEAFDYLIGEKTNNFALKAIKAAAAMLITAEHPVISVNGNIAALCPDALVELSNITGIPLEINIFYGKPGRIEAITEVLRNAGAKYILGTADRPKAKIKELSSNRRYVDPEGIKIADVVMVPLEDGDRTEALIKEGKKVIAIDLNPLSRTAQWATVTIVDNAVRAIPELIGAVRELKKLSRDEVINIINNFNNKDNLKMAIREIVARLSALAEKGVFLELR